MDFLNDIEFPHEAGGGSRPVFIDNTGKLDVWEQGADGTYLSGVGNLTVPEIETVNVATLSSDTTLDNNDETNQLLNPSGNYRVSLSKTATTGKYFNIRHTGTTGSIIVRNDTTTLLTLYPLTSISVIFDGSNWIYRRSPALTRENTDFMGFVHKAELAGSDRFIIEDSVTGKQYTTFEEILEGRGIQFLRKTADQTVTVTTLANDDHLQFAADSSSAYLIEASIQGHTVESGKRIKYNFTVPTGATFTGNLDIAQHGTYVNLWTPVKINQDLASEGNIEITYNDPTLFHMRFSGILVTSSNDGSFKFQFAKYDSDLTSVTIKQNSFLKYTKGT
jgi:hypothetical protein